MDANQLRDYYGSRQFEYGFASRCRMVLPADQLAGRRVLDVCCRRGRGAYRLSELAGRSPADTGLFEWLEPDAGIEDSFARATTVTVDVGGAAPALVFSEGEATV